MMEKENPLASLSDDEVRIVPPDYTLKKIIGEDVDVKKLLSQESLEKAQAVIVQHTDNFLEWVKQDITTLEESYQFAIKDIPASAMHIKKLARAAFVIKSQAGTFGYELASQVAKSLDDFCNKQFKLDADHLMVIRKHIDVIILIFHEKLIGTGDAMGKELTSMLQKLVAKYSV